VVTITEKAAEKIKEIFAESNKDSGQIKLRVFVQGGGCSGFQYGLNLDDEEPQGADQILEIHGIKILVDPISITYLKDAVIDLDDDSGGFKINNPNAKSTCGCGSSFNTE